MESSSLPNRKRPSDRLSPRTLFGHIIPKNIFVNEESESPKQMNLSKAGWKPPLKMGLNNSKDITDIYVDDSIPDYLNNSQNIKCVDSQLNHSLNENNYENESFLKDNIKHIHDSNVVTCENDSQETVLYETSIEMKNMKTIQNFILHEEFNIGPSRDSNNKDELIKMSLENKDDSFDHRRNNDYCNENAPLVQPEKNECMSKDESGNNHVQKVYLGNHFDKSTHDQIQPQPNNYERLQEDNRQLFNSVSDVSHKKDEYDCDKIGKFKRNANLMDMCNMHKNMSEHEIMSGHSQDINHKNKTFNVKRETIEEDDSFDLNLTNSQFLQIENQLESFSNNREMKISDKNQLRSPIETFRRFSTSLKAQTDWQKNILRNMMRDIDELNKAVVDATVSLKAMRKGNSSTK